MELIVAYGVALVAYCGWLSLQDIRQDRRLAVTCRRRRAKRQLILSRRFRSAAVAGRAGGVVAHWPAPAKDSA